MRRPSIALTAALVAALGLAPTALAIGPGGWDHIGTGFPTTTASLNGVVNAMTTQAPGVILVGGAFTSAGGNANAARIARWNGATWTAIGTTPLDNGAVFALAWQDGKLFAGGTFVNAGGNPNADYLAMWDGSTWSPFCTPAVPGPSFTASVRALQIIGNTLYVGGSFQDGAGIPAADYLVACDVTTGTAGSTVLVDGDFNSGVYALAADSNGVLYAGGTFINVAGIAAADHVAAYDGAWHAMGSGVSIGGGAVDSAVRALATSGTDVYIGTDSVDVAGIAAADHVAKWNGSSWSALGANTAGTDGWLPASSVINTLTTTGSLVVAGGSFQNANGAATADDIAYFDGSTWRPIGANGGGNGPVIGNLLSSAVFGGRLFAGGSFTSAGGDTRAAYLTAYSLKQPDLRLGLASAGPFSFNAVYSATAVGEVRTVSVKRGTSRALYLSVQNDGLVPAAFLIKGTGGATGITVRYYRGSTEITAKVKAGTYSTGTIAARGSVTIKMIVRVASKSASAGSFVVRVTSTSGTPSDAVKATVKAK
jgi:hypothetical protein